MQISLIKLLQDSSERDPNNPTSECRKFLRFLKDNGGYGNSVIAWKNIFIPYHQKAQEDFLNEMIANDWIKFEYANRLDIIVVLTEKALKLFEEKIGN